MRLAKIASIVAFVMAGLLVWGALTGPIILLPAALVPLLAGIGILRKRVWSAYGLSLYAAAQLFVLLLLFLRYGAGATLAVIVAQIALIAILVSLFFFAGRSLARTGAARGRGSRLLFSPRFPCFSFRRL